MKDGFCRKELWKQEKSLKKRLSEKVNEDGVQAQIIKYIGKSQY